MPLSLASLGLTGNKKHWLRTAGEKVARFFDFPSEKAGSSSAILWLDRSTLSFIADWRKTKTLETPTCLRACLAPHCTIKMVATLPD